MHQRALHVAGARMHDERRRLVDDDHRRVLEHDREVDGRIGDRERHPRDRRLVDLDELTLDEADLAADGLDTVDSDAGGSDRGRRAGATDVGDERHDAIEPLTGERGWNDL